MPGAEVAIVCGSTLIVPPGVSAIPSSGFEERQVRLLADREDARVRVHRDDVRVVVGRREPPALVEDGHDAPEIDAAEAAAADEARRAPPRHEPDAFLPRFFELLAALRRPEDGHLVEVLERDDGHLGGAAADGGARRVERLLDLQRGFAGQRLVFGRRLVAARAQDRPRGVERNETAADDHDPSAEVHPVPAIDVQKVVDGLDDAVELDAGNLQIAAAPDAHREEHRLEPVAVQLGESERRRQRRTRA